MPLEELKYREQMIEEELAEVLRMAQVQVRFRKAGKDACEAKLRSVSRVRWTERRGFCSPRGYW